MTPKYTLPLPPTTNMAYRSASMKGRAITYKTKEAKQWQQDAVLLIQSQGNKKPNYKVPVWVKMTIYVVYDRDIDSSSKLLLDTLETADILDNDKWIYEQTIRKVKIKRPDEPRVEIEVGEL